MHHTLVAVFDNRGDAESARDDLLASGFSQQEVRLSMGDGGRTDSHAGAASTELADSEPEHHTLGESVRNFFRDVFGTDDSVHAEKYSAAVSRGNHVLTVNAADEPEVERAATSWSATARSTSTRRRPNGPAARRSRIWNRCA